VLKVYFLKPGRGRRAHLTSQQKEQLLSDLSKPPTEFGYKFTNWTGALICEHIKKVYQIDYKLSAVYNLTHNVGYSLTGRLIKRNVNASNNKCVIK